MRRKEKGTGIYQDYIIISPEGIKVHFILVDVRYDFDEDTSDRYGER